MVSQYVTLQNFFFSKSIIIVIGIAPFFENDKLLYIFFDSLTLEGGVLI